MPLRALETFPHAGPRFCTVSRSRLGTWPRWDSAQVVPYGQCVSRRRLFQLIRYAVAWLCDLAIVWIGLTAILNGNAYGVVVALFGTYLLAYEVARLVHRRRPVERIMTLFAVSLFFVLTAWVAIPSALNAASDGAVGLAIGIPGLVLSGFVLRYALRVFAHWRRARPG